MTANRQQQSTNGWTALPIRELCSSIIDCVNKTAPVVEGPTPYRMIRTTNVKNGRVDLASVRYVEADTYRRWVRRGEPREGDIVLTREAPLGEVGMLRDAAGVFLGQRLVMYRADPERADRHFLLYAMRGATVQNQIKAFGSGATVEHMRVPDCGELLVSCPDIWTQRRVGALLAAFDELIEIKERGIEILENVVGSVYREWFLRYRFPGHEGVNFVDSDLGLIPEGWAVACLGDLATLRYGKALPAPKRRPGPYPVVSSAGVVGEHDEPLIGSRGIVIGRKGNVGSIWWVDGPFFPIDTTYYVETDVPLGLMYWQLQDLAFIDSHAAVPGLSRNQAESLLVLDVEASVARRFEAIHSPCFDLMAELRNQSRRLAAARDLLLPRLVTGRLDISDIDLGALLGEAEDS